MIPRAALIQALPPRAAEALLLARQFDRDCDPAAAWLMAVERPSASPDALARGLRAQARRHRRAGGEHGPAWFASAEGCDAFKHQGGEDPADLLEAVQEVGRRPGLGQELALREAASDTGELARRERITLRRAQQVLAERRLAEQEGQGVLL